MPSTSQVFTVGQILTAAQMNQLPQGVLTSQFGTVSVGPTSGTTELDVITAPAVTIVAGRRIRVSFHATGINETVLGDSFTMRIKEGATVLQESTYRDEAAAVTKSVACDFMALVNNPSAASHTYKVTIQRSAGTGTASIAGTSTAPITILVEDVGQA